MNTARRGLPLPHDEFVSSARSHPAVPWRVLLGIDTLQPPTIYHWDGLKRGGEIRHPTFIFQYTHSGWGRFEREGRSFQIGSGQAFLAWIPSAHRYFFPPDSPHWSFFWVMLDHPFIVERLTALIARSGPVLAVPAESSTMMLLKDIFERLKAGAFQDTYALEVELFAWMIELERHADALLYPQQGREQLLAKVRAQVLDRLQRPVNVDELASRECMSPSHYSHHFKAVTGLRPSDYLLQVRLEVVVSRLRDPRSTLKEIAAATGFADANHLCKCFRRRFHLSPGQFRRLVPSGGKGESGRRI